MELTSSFFTLVLALSAAVAALANPGIPEVPYRVAEKMWNLELGAHRAKVHVGAPAPAIRAHLPWRLQLQGMETHQILVMEGATGTAVKNVVRAAADRMAGDIIFEAATAGDYYAQPLQPRAAGHMGKWRQRWRHRH